MLQNTDDDICICTVMHAALIRGIFSAKLSGIRGNCTGPSLVEGGQGELEVEDLPHKLGHFAPPRLDERVQECSGKQNCG